MSEPLQQHPLGKLLPPMTDEEFSKLCEDIKTHGFSTEHDIVIYEEMVLDGWHRHLASLEVGIRASYKQFISPDMADTALDFVIQENLHRRHLSVSQRAAIAAELMERSLDATGEEKPQDEAAEGLNDPILVGVDVQKESHRTNTKPLTIAKAAEIMHVSPSSVKRAKAKKKANITDEEKAKAKTDKRQANIRTATKIIEDTLGEGWVKQSKISSNDTIALSGVVPEEMKRVEPFLRAGWKLSAALGHKSVSLTHAHSIRQLLDRAIEFGKFTLDIEDWTVTVTKKEP